MSQILFSHRKRRRSFSRAPLPDRQSPEKELVSVGKEPLQFTLYFRGAYRYTPRCGPARRGPLWLVRPRRPVSRDVSLSRGRINDVTMPLVVVAPMIWRFPDSREKTRRRRKSIRVPTSSSSMWLPAGVRFHQSTKHKRVVCGC
jgi:hypothetical protein